MQALVEGVRAASGWARFRGLAAALVPQRLADHLEDERARWFLWLPVMTGLGIAAYFALPAEPGLAVALAVPFAAVGLVASTRRTSLMRAAALGLLAAALGFAVAKGRTEATRAPVLDREMRRADVTGVVELIEPRPGRGERLTIRAASIAGLEAGETPTHIRVRVMTKREGLKPGDWVHLRATLRPPSPPSLPGGYDFARWAWFQGLGATGYAIHPPDIILAPASGTSLAPPARRSIELLRQGIAERIRAALPGEAGAIAVSLITGERGGITEETNDAYRDSGLIHILSISGLHMVIMAGSVYAAVRLGLALFPAIALRFPTKKWAAAAALCGAGGYLLISAPSIATLRAFLMIAIMFLAVMVDRQALAMRNVAIAALVILVVFPESLLDPGFQMSFAAVVSLIAAYETARARADEQDRGGWLRALAFFLGGIVLSTVVASLSVAPIGAYHFHRSQQYALIANLIAVPICNLIVMPAALATLLLMPLGLETWPLALMGLGIDAMTATARWVASLPGAVIHIAEIPDASFALMIAGGLWLTLWQTRWRALGLAAIAAGVMVAANGSERPDILAGRAGTLVAVRGSDARLAAAGPRSGTFELERWLEHDGDGRKPREALRTRGFRCDDAGCIAEVKGLTVAKTRHASAIAEDCAKAHIVITELPAPRDCTAPLLVLDRRALARDGTHAIYIAGDAPNGAARISRIIRIETVAARRGNRPWTERRERTKSWTRD
ncbi:MAG: ComEC/Rec2 family competence protein [Hyphomicrobium sp.]|uniref:ComEC/Rec2 family competence protein n=1 Tax=Hyphomicrobium sp. TaxID=82 RepID=UPI003D137CD5